MFKISFSSPVFLLVAAVLGVSVVGTAMFYSQYHQDTDAEMYFIQSAAAHVPMSKIVSAELRRAPSAGDLIVAVVSNQIPSDFVPPSEWQVAINESTMSPGLSILYRVAGEQEPSRIEVSGFSQYSDLALQVFEYRGLNVGVSPYLVRSSSGKGRDMELADVQIGEQDSIAIIAAATGGREILRGWQPETFDPRRETQTTGSGALTLVSGEQFFSAGDLTRIRADISSFEPWHLQTVVFRVTPELSIASEEDVYSPADYLSIEVEVDSPVQKEWNDVTYTITVKNDGTEPITNLEVGAHLPKEVALKNAIVENGSYMPYSNLWFLPTLEAGTEGVLKLTATIKLDTALSSFIFKPSILYFDQYQEGEVDLWDAVSVDVTRLTFREKLEIPDTCPEIDYESISINDGAEEIESNAITVFGDATNATFMLLNNRADITSAQVFPMKVNNPYSVDSTPGEKEVFAWFGSICTRSGVVSDSVTLLDPVAVEEEVADENGEESSEEGDAADATEEDVEAEQPSDEKTGQQASKEESDQEDVEEEPVPEPPPVVEQSQKIPAGCAPATPFVSYLYAGSTGSEVERLQQTLACLGYYSGDVDGVFSQAVTTAVANVQSAYGLTVSGAMNLVTRELLSGY